MLPASNGEDANATGALGISNYMYVDEPDASGEDDLIAHEETPREGELTPAVGGTSEEPAMNAEAPVVTNSATPVHIMVRLPSGAHLPETTRSKASKLKAAVLVQCGLPPVAAQRIGRASTRPYCPC